MQKIKEFYFKNKKICDIAIVFMCCYLAWLSQYLPIGVIRHFPYSK
jgi:hypothetical protein